MDFFRAGGTNMYILAALGVAIAIPAVKFARAPDAQRLSLIRALTVALVAGSVAGTVSGIAMTFHGIAGNPHVLENPLPILLQGCAESMTNLILGLGLVLLAWILVAVGVRRMPKAGL